MVPYSTGTRKICPIHLGVLNGQTPVGHGTHLSGVLKVWYGKHVVCHLWSPGVFNLMHSRTPWSPRTLGSTQSLLKAGPGSGSALCPWHPASWHRMRAQETSTEFHRPFHCIHRLPETFLCPPPPSRTDLAIPDSNSLCYLKIFPSKRILCYP